MVEPPGIAPGSGPLITGAFIAIVRPKPDEGNIGVAWAVSKPRRQAPGSRSQSGVWFRNQVSCRFA